MIPAGEYYIGDPCYVFSEADWDTICRQDSKNVHEIHGKKFADASTGGDGSFLDTNGNSYSVDSGSLGVVPIDLVFNQEDALRQGRIVVFETPVLFKYIEDELLVIGDIVFNLDEVELDEEYVKDVEGFDYWEIWE